MQVLFSDESQIQIVINSNIHVRRKRGDKYTASTVRQTVKHPTSVMIWGVICGKGAGKIYFVDGTMRKEQYIEVLKTVLFPQIAEWYGRRPDCIFMQDGAPCHKAAEVTKFLNTKKVRILDWAGNSPDCNPIENVWHVLKMELNKRYITTRDQLIEAIKDVWYNSDLIKKTIQNSIASMPERCKAVVRAKGQWTKY